MTEEHNPTLELWYDKPADQWLEALPVGNGRIGAMIYGGAGEERIQLNEATIWSGGPHDYANSKGPDVLEQVRELVFAERWEEAVVLAEDGLLGKPAVQASYQTAGELVLTFDSISDNAATNYRRNLDLDKAIVSSRFTIGKVNYSREIFASYPDQVIVVSLTSNSPATISFDAEFDSLQQTTSRIVDGRLIMDGVSGDAPCGPGQVRFCVIVEARAEGDFTSITAGEDGYILSLEDANSVSLLISIGTSYRNYLDVSADPEKIAMTHLEAATKYTQDDLRQRHIADYQSLFRRFSLTIGSEECEQSVLPTSARIAAQEHADDPGLAVLYCQYGRYLTIAGSRAGGMPTTLQGLWNNQLSPAWGSKYTININTEMNYWLTAPGNLCECYSPLFSLLKSAATSGQRTARVQYGASGWVAHHNLDAWMGTSVVDFIFHGLWMTGGAWLCKSVWDHYEFTGDLQTLKDNYKLLIGSSQFFLDTLVKHPKHEWLVTCPSNSPENGHHSDYSICAGPSMDMSILRDLFQNTVKAATLLGIDSEQCSLLQDARSRLAPLQIGSSGQLQEWLDDWDADAPEQEHRHVSHLYALHPSDQITPDRTPALADACRQTLAVRGDESTGWATVWRILFWSRLHDSEHAYKVLRFLLTPERTAPNLFDLHPPFQIDGNYGGAAAVLEMLVHSHETTDDGKRILRILPALPKAWPSGKLTGVLARGAFELDLEWKHGSLASLSIKSLLGSEATVIYNGQTLDERFLPTWPVQAGKVSQALLG